MPIPRYALLYVDASAGASGDMFLGALIDLGYPLRRMEEDLSALGLRSIRLRRRRVRRSGLVATRVEVATGKDQPHRGRREIRALLRRARLDPSIRRRAGEVFENLIAVEAGLHGITPDKVHLHEVGALDALADVVGTVSALDRMGVSKIVVSPVNLGQGRVRCEHGELPVPAPATAALLRGRPVYGDGEGEKTTPTGAALIATLASAFGPLPPMRIGAIGCGAGRREDADRPNILRLLAGLPDASPLQPAAGSSMVEIRTEIDDADPRLLGSLMDRLLSGGASDVFLCPVQMKKNRPGTLVVVLAARADAGRLGRMLFDETPTLGYRLVGVERVERPRRHVSVRTRYGTVRIKVAEGDGAVPVATPEYEDCLRLARSRSVPVRVILAAAAAAFAARSPRSRRSRP